MRSDNFHLFIIVIVIVIAVWIEHREIYVSVSDGVGTGYMGYALVTVTVKWSFILSIARAPIVRRVSTYPLDVRVCELDLGRMWCRFVNSLFQMFILTRPLALILKETTQNNVAQIFSAQFITKLYCINRHSFYTTRFSFCFVRSFVSC